MKFRLVPASEPLSRKNLFVVLFGQPGVGKTSLSFTMPGPVLHFDFDKGIDRADQRKRPDFFEVHNFGDLSDFVASDDFAALVEEKGYKSVVIDTVGTLLDDYIAPHLISVDPKNGNYNGGLTLQGWGALSTAFNAFKVRLQSLGLHICAISHEKEEGDGNAKQIRLAVKGGSTDIIYRSCDMMGYLSIVGTKRTIDFNPTQAHVGKNVAGLPATAIPSTDSPTFSSFLSDKVVGAALEKMSAKSEAQVAAQQAVEAYRSKLAECKTPEDFSRFVEDLSDEKGATIKTQVRAALADAIKSAGMKYDKDIGKVVIDEPENAQI